MATTFRKLGRNAPTTQWTPSAFGKIVSRETAYSTLVATDSDVIYNGACMACVGSGSDAKCSIAAIDAEEI